MTKLRSCSLKFLMIVVALCGILLFLISVIPIPRAFEHAFAVRQVPEEYPFDLHEWLDDQPGVERVIIVCDNDNSEIRITWIHVSANWYPVNLTERIRMHMDNRGFFDKTKLPINAHH